MKSFVFNSFGLENLKLTETEEAETGSNEVKVRLRAASLNYRDLLIVSGKYNPRMRLPAIPLSDGAGEVVEVGKEVSDFKIGDRVMPIFVQEWLDGPLDEKKRRSSLGSGSDWNGVLCQYRNFSEKSVVKIPDYLSYEEAATLPCAAVTAWHALVVSGGIKAGDTVLVLGSGGVSVFALQIAKLHSARVIATTSSNEKAERLKTLGADAGIDYKQNPDWDKIVRELTNGQGVDHVVEVGGAGTIEKSLKSVRFGGHIAVIGVVAGSGGFDLTPAFMKAVRLQGIFVGSKAMFEQMNKAFALNELRPVIDRVFGFNDAVNAFEYLSSGNHFGKVVIKID